MVVGDGYVGTVVAAILAHVDADVVALEVAIVDRERGTLLVDAFSIFEPSMVDADGMNCAGSGDWASGAPGDR